MLLDARMRKTTPTPNNVKSMDNDTRRLATAQKQVKLPNIKFID